MNPAILERINELNNGYLRGGPTFCEWVSMVTDRALDTQRMDTITELWAEGRL
jgi:hypothetical protein